MDCEQILSDEHEQFRPRHKPKAEAAALVANSGSKIPKIYPTLKDALQNARDSKHGFVIRSEHPDEFDGPSGLLESFFITPEVIKLASSYAKDGVPSNAPKDMTWRLAQYLKNVTTEREFEEALIDESKENINNYCERLELDVDTFRRQISYSYWEKLGGYNRTIVADSAIPGRFHLFTNSADLPSAYWSYIITDGENVSFPGHQPMPKEIETEIPTVIQFYDQIRLLPQFDPKKILLLEFQTVGNENYFLQLHETGSFRPTTFNLNRPPKDGEIEASFVRGATPPTGINVEITVYFVRDGIGEYPLVKRESAIDYTFDLVFSEIMVRRREAQFLELSPEKLSDSAQSTEHAKKSALFKPEISVMLPLMELFPDEGVKVLFAPHGPPKKIRARVISDGKRAFVKILKASP